MAEPIEAPSAPSACDVVIDRVTPSAGVELFQPAVGTVPAGVEIEADLPGAARVEVAAHGDLTISTARRGADGRWRTEVPAVLLERSFELTVGLAASPDEALQPVAAIAGRNHRYSDLASVTPRPLLVHQLARGGSTMTMRLLTGHPQIAGFTAYPLEHRPGLAWTHTLTVLLGEQSVPPAEAAFFDATRTVTANPYTRREVLGDQLSADLDRGPHDALRSAIAETVSTTYRAQAPDAVFWAEKFRHESPGANLTQQAALATWPGARQLILVRDPRDLLCSRLAFNRRRGFASFDLDLDDDATTGAPSIVASMRLAARHATAFPDALVVRYEDMVLSPTATATRVFRTLGLSHGYGVVRAAVDAALAPDDEGHRTSSSPAASIGRWRDELPVEVDDHVRRELAHELELFGYLE